MFTIPNEADAGWAAQAETDKVDFDALAAGFGATGVVSGAGVTAQGTPDMTLAVAAGVIAVGGVKATVAAGNVTITTADATNPRFDLVVVSAAGVKSVTAGTAAAAPAFPAIPASSVVLAAVYVPAGDTAIGSTQIVDKRVLLYLPSFVGAVATRTASQAISNNTSTLVQFDTEDIDSDGFHDNVTNNTRLTVPAGLGGKYRVTGGYSFEAMTAGKVHIGTVKKNGAAITKLQTQLTTGATASVWAPIPSLPIALLATDYLELEVFQNNGGTVNLRGVDTTLAIERISD